MLAEYGTGPINLAVLLCDGRQELVVTYGIIWRVVRVLSEVCQEIKIGFGLYIKIGYSSIQINGSLATNGKLENDPN